MGGISRHFQGAITVITERFTRAFGGGAYPIPHLLDGKVESAILPSAAALKAPRDEDSDAHRAEENFHGILASVSHTLFRGGLAGARRGCAGIGRSLRHPLN